MFLGWQVYDTPPSGRWQRPVLSSLADEDIYDTPRSVPPQADSESEVNKKSYLFLALLYRREGLLYQGKRGGGVGNLN